MEEVILVDANDQEIGVAEKIKAHETGQLHRAFSVFVFNSKGQLLIHQRALEKYHSGGLWTNTCCSHPRPSETTVDAAHRRLQEEMGMDCKLTEQFQFIYKAKLGNGLIEHEYDHVFVGRTDIMPNPNSNEVAKINYISLEELEQAIVSHPEKYTAWFKICLIKHAPVLKSASINC